MEFSLYRPDQLVELNSLHRLAAHRFLDDAATGYYARASTIDHDKYPMAKLYRYKWEPASLRGAQISFAEFWGTDNVTPEQIGERAWSIPNVDGYKTAFFHPPHGLQNGVDANHSLFAEINRHLFGNDPNALIIWSWSTDCSGYFDAGHEWWGAYLWTLSRKTTDTVTLIAASSTD